MVGRTPKNTVQDWIKAATRMLVDEGIAGLKVDRLANRLGVTRGGFYHNPSTDTTTPYCRHTWMSHVVMEER